MPLPYTIATLLYAFNKAGEALLLERNQEPNRGLWSPAGGKLDTAAGESPHACACREAREELGLILSPRDVRLAGLVSEHGYEGRAHWLMFLFEIIPPVEILPPPHREGFFRFVPPAELPRLRLPDTDRERIWPLFFRNRGGFFAAHCHCHPGGRHEWLIEETRAPGRPADDRELSSP
jgi:8-oxo-dGTP diphosphatase